MSEIILSGAEDNEQTSKQTNKRTNRIYSGFITRVSAILPGKIESVSNAPGGRIYVKREVSKFGKLRQLNDPYLSESICPLVHTV